MPAPRRHINLSVHTCRAYSDRVDHVDLERIWKDSPIGISIYEPVLDAEGVLQDMTLVWVNRAVSQLGGFQPADMLGWSVGRVVGEDNWNSVRHLYIELLATGRPIGYARNYDQNGVNFAFRAAAWYSPPHVAVQVRETSTDKLLYREPDDIDAALRLVEWRTQATLELARLLATLKQPLSPERTDELNRSQTHLNELADPAGVEPATSGFSDQRSAELS